MTETSAVKAPSESRELLRHTVATLAYRGGKAVAGEAAAAADFHAGKSSRTPAEILAHMGDLLDWAYSLAEGRQRWNNSVPLPWDEEVMRFHAVLARFDDFLASDRPLSCSVETLFQGPVADALTHVGQINLLRRLAEVPIRGENYSRANIEKGRVGPDQSTDRVEFD